MSHLFVAIRPIFRPAIGLVIAMAAPLSLAQDSEVLEEYWYVLNLDGARAGWMHNTFTREGALLRSENDTKITVRRGTAQITAHVKETFVETMDGTPIEAELAHRFGLVDVSQRLRFDGPHVTVEHRQGAQTRTDTHHIAKTWIPPAAVQRRIEQALAEGAEQITYHTIQPAMGPQVVEVTIQIIGQEPVEVYGKVVPATSWKVRTSALSGVETRDFVDERGRLLKSSMQVAGMAFTLLRADEALAMSPAQAPEMMTRTLVDAGGPIAAPHQLTRATYRMRIDPNAAGDHDRSRPVETAAQRVIWLDDHTAEITVDLQAGYDQPGDAPTAAHRHPSAMIDSDAASVRGLLDAIADEDERRGMARNVLADTMRRFVRGHVTQKNLSVGFATASETARSGQGDCTEHAVLLAALLRAANIPSRTVTGLVYSDRFLGQAHVFVYHMWTQAWIEDAQGRGRWLDLDATRHHTPFDAAHIALGTSALSDDGFYNDLLLVAPFIGTLAIEVMPPGDTAR